VYGVAPHALTIVEHVIQMPPMIVSKTAPAHGAGMLCETIVEFATQIPTIIVLRTVLVLREAQPLEIIVELATLSLQMIAAKIARESGVETQLTITVEVVMQILLMIVLRTALVYGVAQRLLTIAQDVEETAQETALACGVVLRQQIIVAPATQMQTMIAAIHHIFTYLHPPRGVHWERLVSWPTVHKSSKMARCLELIMQDRSGQVVSILVTLFLQHKQSLDLCVQEVTRTN
jgi:hypothetical protein